MCDPRWAAGPLSRVPGYAGSEAALDEGYRRPPKVADIPSPSLCTRGAPGASGVEEVPRDQDVNTAPPCGHRELVAGGQDSAAPPL